MNRKWLLLTLAMAAPVAAAEPTANRTIESTNFQFVQTTFLSECQRQPDPATLNYYWRRLNEGTWSNDDVRQAIETSCERHKAPSACSHVAGLDLCQTPS